MAITFNFQSITISFYLNKEKNLLSTKRWQQTMHYNSIWKGLFISSMCLQRSSKHSVYHPFIDNKFFDKGEEEREKEKRKKRKKIRKRK